MISKILIDFIVLSLPWQHYLNQLTFCFETEEQAAFLLQAGCAYAQGYFYSRPLPIPQFEALAVGTEHPFPVAPSIKALAEKLEKGST